MNIKAIFWEAVNDLQSLRVPIKRSLILFNQNCLKLEVVEFWSWVHAFLEQLLAWFVNISLK